MPLCGKGREGGELPTTSHIPVPEASLRALISSKTRSRPSLGRFISSWPLYLFSPFRLLPPPPPPSPPPGGQRLPPSSRFPPPASLFSPSHPPPPPPLLQACGWDLESAVNLHMAAGPDAGLSVVGQGHGVSHHVDDAALARQLQAEQDAQVARDLADADRPGSGAGPGPGAEVDDDGVRQALPQTMERLVGGDSPGPDFHDEILRQMRGQRHRVAMDDELRDLVRRGRARNAGENGAAGAGGRGRGGRGGLSAMARMLGVDVDDDMDHLDDLERDLDLVDEYTDDEDLSDDGSTRGRGRRGLAGAGRRIQARGERGPRPAFPSDGFPRAAPSSTVSTSTRSRSRTALSLEDARARAERESRWLICHVRSSGDIASRMLDRDVWASPMISAIVDPAFEVYHVEARTEEGRKVLNFYQLSDPPVILVVDPITGQLMKQFRAPIEADRFVELLVDYLENKPGDDAAALLATRASRPVGIGVGGEGAGPGAGAGPEPGPGVSETEDAALARALQESADAHHARILEDEDDVIVVSGGPGVGSATGAPSTKPILDQTPRTTSATATATANPTTNASSSHNTHTAANPEELQRKYQQRTPSEPPLEHASEDVIRLALKMPTGVRLQRRFRASDRVVALFDWCRGEVTEAAMGRGFVLREALPGSTPIACPDEGEACAGGAGGGTLREAGLHDCMMVMTWVD